MGNYRRCTNIPYRHPAIFLTLFGLLSTVSPTAIAHDAQHDAVKQVAPTLIPINHNNIGIYSSATWQQPQPQFTRAVIIVHGLQRNAKHYYQTMLKARDASQTAQSTLIIAPQFLTLTDVQHHHLGTERLYWSWTGWESGENAQNAPISAFTVLDSVIKQLSDRQRFPNLHDIVLVGHSGGAQLVQRYALADNLAKTLNSQAIKLQYVVASPSSYVYFTAERPVPVNISQCPKVNDWRFGLSHRPAYFANQSNDALIQSYLAKSITYFVGSEDNNPHNHVMDKSCMANAQGANRYTRSHAYYHYLQQHYQVAPRQQLWDVIGVGHADRPLFLSSCAQQVIFNSQRRGQDCKLVQP